MVMEILTLIVKKKVEESTLFKYHFGCKMMKLTHVCFADDLLMFFHGDMDSVMVLKKEIEEFGGMTGLLPNYNKSTIIFGSMNENDKQDILRNVLFKVEKLPVKYLNVPLTSKRLSLIASVLESIHVYWPKSQGGLGLKDLGVWNTTMIAKHLWHLATNKQSLWVKWVNVVKLKGKSIWVVNEEVSDSWGWRNILRIREDVRKYLVMKIGNGGNTSVIYDNWSSIGVLQSFITHRDLYNLNSLNSITLGNLDDELVCRSIKGKEGKFTVKHAYNDIRSQNDEVSWGRLVWFSQNIPKHAFVLWMAIQNKITTQDKVKRWGSFDMMCSYTREVWRNAMLKLNVRIGIGDWNMVINHMAGLYCGNSIASVIRRLGFAACVYLIWQERNLRIFRDEKRSSKELCEVFDDTVRMRILSLKVKNTKFVLQVEKRWNTNMNKVCNKEQTTD
ncbi:RNA-directed DNA polymerase, eukaryota, reverse transcriptase zinc-binding domain protein [Tanacetum coccineum]